MVQRESQLALTIRRVGIPPCTRLGGAGQTGSFAFSEISHHYE
jgi:hypothetical protein